MQPYFLWQVFAIPVLPVWLYPKRNQDRYPNGRGFPVFARQFTGFVLYDPETKETLINKNGSNYFTPASNTKILSCYTALKILGDSLPVLNYLEKEEAFYFWGTGNPLLLHPDFDGQNEALELLRKAGKPLRLVEQKFPGQQVWGRMDVGRLSLLFPGRKIRPAALWKCGKIYAKPRGRNAGNLS